jgi:hypothetical protein
VGGQHHAPAASPPGDPVPMYRAGWDPGPAWAENFAPPSLTGTFFILRRIQRDVIKNLHRSLPKVAIILVRF